MRVDELSLLSSGEREEESDSAKKWRRRLLTVLGDYRTPYFDSIDILQCRKSWNINTMLFPRQNVDAYCKSGIHLWTCADRLENSRSL